MMIVAREKEDKTILSQAQRARAKALAVSAETLEYITFLEAIAEAAFDLWIQLGQPQEKRCADDLYDELEHVDFMHDED